MPSCTKYLNHKKNWLEKLLACLIVILAIFIFQFNVNTVEAQTNQVDRTYILANKQQVSIVENKLKSINPKMSISILPEISTIHVSNINPKDLIKMESDNLLKVHHGTAGITTKIDGEATTLMNNYRGDLNNESIATLKKESTDLSPWNVQTILKNANKNLDGIGVKVAEIDSGVDLNNDAIKDNINRTQMESFVTDDSSIKDETGHGTMVAGVMTQIASKVYITPYKVIGSHDGESIWAIQAIVRAVNDGNRVINLSVGSIKELSNQDDLLTIKGYQRALNYAKQHGVLVIASSGNTGVNLDEMSQQQQKHVPGSLKNVITVGAVSRFNKRSSYSNYGHSIDLVAPGGDTVDSNGSFDPAGLETVAFPTYLDNKLTDYGIPQGVNFSYGTSLAAPAVSAVAAILMADSWNKYQYFPWSWLTEGVLEQSATDLGTKGKDIEYGYGLINLESAEQLLEQNR